MYTWSNPPVSRAYPHVTLRPAAWRWPALVVLTVALLSIPNLCAANPQVQFDTTYVVSCRDVTTPEFQESNPHERLIRATFRITAMIQSHETADRMQYVYQILNPAGNVQIVDYEPKTVMDTAYAGDITFDKKKETNKSLGVSLSGSFEHLVRGTVGSDLGSKDSVHKTYSLKPPMEIVSAAGTVQRGTGVYFKLWPSPDSSLEGSRDFVLIMRVPRTWRGDVMYVRCEALEKRRSDLVPRGAGRFVVALHAEGDDEVREAAEDLIRAESMLRRTVAHRRDSIQKKAFPTVVHRVGAALDVYSPRIPESWLNRLIFGPTDIEKHSFVHHLPEQVRKMAREYGRAKRTLFQFSQGRLTRREVSRHLSAR